MRCGRRISVVTIIADAIIICRCVCSMARAITPKQTGLPLHLNGSHSSMNSQPPRTYPKFTAPVGPSHLPKGTLHVLLLHDDPLSPPEYAHGSMTSPSLAFSRVVAVGACVVVGE